MNRPLRIQIVAASLALILAGPARAQVSAGQILNNLRSEQRGRQALPTPTPGASAPPAQASAPASPRVGHPLHFVIRSVRFVGAPPRDQAALQKLVAPDLNRSIDFQTLQQAADRVAGYFQQQGRLVHVLIPAQDITAGVVSLRIVHARLGQVQVIDTSTGNITLTIGNTDSSTSVDLGTRGAIAILPQNASGFVGGFGSSEFVLNPTIANVTYIPDSLVFGNPTGTSYVAWNACATIHGPISIYGGTLNISSPMISNASGDIWLQANSNAASASLLLTSSIEKTGGALSNITLRGASRVDNQGNITASNVAANIIEWANYGNNGSLTVTPAALTVTASNQTKVYGQSFSFNGTEFTSSGLVNNQTLTSATLASNGSAATAAVANGPYVITIANASGSGFVASTVSTANLSYSDPNVGTGKTLNLNGVTILDGNGSNGSANYVITLAANSSSTITQLGSVTWIGGSSGNWFDPANWAGGAVPDLNNVANYTQSGGVTSSAGNTSVGGSYTQKGGFTHVCATLAVNGGYAQSNGSTQAGCITVGGGYAQSGGTTASAGSIGVTGNFSQSGGTTSSAGNTSIGGSYGQSGGSARIGGTLAVSGNYTQSNGSTQAGCITIGGIYGQTGGNTSSVGNFSVGTSAQGGGNPGGSGVSGSSSAPGGFVQSGGSLTIGGSGVITSNGSVILNKVSTGGSLQVTSSFGNIQRTARGNLRSGGSANFSAPHGSVSLGTGNDFGGGLVINQGGTQPSGRSVAANGSSWVFQQAMLVPWTAQSSGLPVLLDANGLPAWAELVPGEKPGVTGLTLHEVRLRGRRNRLHDQAVQRRGGHLLIVDLQAGAASPGALPAHPTHNSFEEP